MRRALFLSVLAGCATVAPAPAQPVEPTAVELACLDALKASGARLSSDGLSACERDSDCRAVSPLLSGHCGTVVNAKVFEAHLEQFAAQTQTCAPVVQVVPRCLRLQPVCRGKRCTAEPIAELPDECAELRTALEADAAAANGCSVDAECTQLEDRPTTVSFALAALERREKLARACGTIEPALFLVRPEPIETFCITGKCVSEKASAQFTTVVRGQTFTRPQLDTECIMDKFFEALGGPRTLRKKQWELSFMANLDTEGRLNQFEFDVPANLSPAAQRAFASRLHECTAKEPARLRGKPIAVRRRSTIRWMSR